MFTVRVAAARDVSFVILNNRRYAALGHFAQRFGMRAIPGVEDLDSGVAWSFDRVGPALVEIARG